MKPMSVTIPGDMRGKQRPRMALRGRHVHAYTPDETVNAEAWVRHCCIDQIGHPRLEGPLVVDIDIKTTIPASWPKKKRADAMAGVLWPTGKPDCSNMCKTVEDALNGILWLDDAQIVTLRVRKSYGIAAETTLTVQAP